MNLGAYDAQPQGKVQLAGGLSSGVAVTQRDTQDGFPGFRSHVEVAAAGQFVGQCRGLFPRRATHVNRFHTVSQHPADFGGALPGYAGVQAGVEDDVGASSGYMRGDGDCAEGPGVADDAGLGMGGDGVQHTMRYAPFRQEAAQLFRLLHRAGSGQDRLARAVAGGDFVPPLPPACPRGSGTLRSADLCAWADTTGGTTATSSPYLRRNSPAAGAAVPVMPAIRR